MKNQETNHEKREDVRQLTIIYGFVIVVSNIFWLNLRVKTKKKKQRIKEFYPKLNFIFECCCRLGGQI